MNSVVQHVQKSPFSLDYGNCSLARYGSLRDLQTTLAAPLHHLSISTKMAAEAQAEVQALLAFLTREAKIPLAAALPKYNVLRKQGLTTPDAIAKSDADTLKSIFGDDKLVKQVHNAAKRLTNPKKRAASSNLSAPNKQAKRDPDQETQLRLPETDLSLDDLRSKTIETNRAPLFLAFALTVSKYVLANQPLSSRLSIAQAVTSAGAQSKAKFIGLTNTTAEDEGWAQGQPKIRLMGRQVAVMRRHIVVPIVSEESFKQEPVEDGAQDTSHEAFWGIDLEALKKSNGPLVAGKLSGSAGPPIHRPEAAKAYLLKSIDISHSDDFYEHNDSIKTEGGDSPTKPKKITASERAAQREQAVAMLLKAIDHVCASWHSTLTSDELDRRASSWYTHTRPDVENGRAGWGQRGKVPLLAILDFAKSS